MTQPVGSAMYTTGVYSDKNKMTALLLCLLGFIGLAGFHEFYVGKTLMGILYFFTVGFFLIGTLISLLAILTGNFKDNTGRVMRS